jgi:deoxyribodipyrimidine photo-lyase
MSSIFIFHRDLRIIDNLALNKLSTISKNIIPIFIFNPKQISSKENKYFNDNSVQFMIESLKNLKKFTKGKLQFFYGDPKKVLNSIVKNNDISTIAFNSDYTPFSKQRDKGYYSVAKKYNIEVITEQDYTLVDMETIRDRHYSVFNPYYKKVLKSDIENPSRSIIHFSNKKLKGISSYLFNNIDSLYNKNNNVLVHGNRKDALIILKNIRKFKNYSKSRNNPSINTSLLSAHIKFGTVSIREVFYSMKKNKELTRQLIWHDFYAQLMYYLPKKQTIGGGNFKNKNIKWISSSSQFKAWCEGKTGFPMVDAGMRQLNKIGWMHNRLRLIVSNFLTLILGIDWRKGEKYFAQKLIDYDLSSNNGNWQFSAQVGIDRVPYLRIYNPFTQAKEIDPKCEYIKEWVEELRDIDNYDILRWYKVCKEYKGVYKCPIVDLKEKMKEAKNRYKKISK